MAQKDQNQSRIVIEPAPNSPGVVIDPKDPQAQRKFQVQQRGGAYSDRVRIDPYAKKYLAKRMGQRKAMVKT